MRISSVPFETETGNALFNHNLIHGAAEGDNAFSGSLSTNLLLHIEGH
jgi:hypothetical protein